MRHAAIEEIRAYWEALREDGQIPRRAQVDPRGIEGALEHAFVLERAAPGQARFRVTGLHLNDLMGMEVRGMPLSAIFLPAARENLSSVLEGIFVKPCLAEIGIRANGGPRQPELKGQMILMPLRSDKGEISRALGALVVEGEKGRAPRRLVMTGVKTTALPSPDMPHAAPAAYDFAPSTATGLAEGTASFTHAPRPYLRLVKTESD